MRHSCSEHKLLRSRCLCLPFYSSSSQGDPENMALKLLHHTNSPRLARDALVLGPSGARSGDPISTISVNNASQTAPQPSVPQQSTTSETPWLVSRSGLFQEQGFSVEVAERIASTERSSTRTVYKLKWALFDMLCREISVDFSPPSVKQVLDIFMNLFQDINRHTSTIIIGLPFLTHYTGDCSCFDYHCG